MRMILPSFTSTIEALAPFSGTPQKLMSRTSVFSPRGYRSCSCPPPYPYLPMLACGEPSPRPGFDPVGILTMRISATALRASSIPRWAMSSDGRSRLAAGAGLEAPKSAPRPALRRTAPAFPTRGQYSRRVSRRAARNAAMPAPSSSPKRCSWSRGASVTRAIASPGAQSGSACPAPTRNSSTRCGAVFL